MVWMTASDPGCAGPMREKNDIVFDLAASHPDRIIPYCTLSANEQGRCLDELKRCLDCGPCIGVKMHRYYQPAYTLKSDFLQPVLELLAEHRLVYMNHVFQNHEHLRWAMQKYPDVTFMSGHIDRTIHALALAHANLCDCTCAAMRPDELADEVRRHGRSDRLLVGSDFGLFCLAFGIGMVAYADIDEEHKRNILGRNAVRLLERTRWYTPAMLRSLPRCQMRRTDQRLACTST
jgi:predicted TIM-barrel fold metal-dependent hydrolase